MSTKPNTAKYFLLDLVEISAGHPIRQSVDKLSAGDTAVVQMRDVKSPSLIDWSTAAKVKLPTKKQPDWLQDGDILLSTRGTNNYAALMSSPPSLAVAAPSFFVLRILDKQLVLPGFLCWFLNQAHAQLYFQQTATGSYILNLRRAAVEQLPVVLPPLKQQQLISDLFRLAEEEKKLMEELIENRQYQLQALALELH